jgi:hypothetical protein
MKITISLPKTLVAELDELIHQNGRLNRNRIIQKFLRDSVARERQMRVAKLYCKGRKTLRQCAELLGVDLRQMIDILYNLDIPLDGGVHSPQNELTLKSMREWRSQQAF